MTQQLNSAKAENKKSIVEDISKLIQQQKQTIQEQEKEIQHQEKEIEKLKIMISNNRLAEANAIRQLKNIYSKVYIEANESRRCLSFSKTIGNESSIERNEDHLFAKQHTLIHLKSNSICTWIPKVGCTNMRYSIPLANGAISTPADIEWIHNNNNSFTADNKELLAANYTFVVLRNPFKRLISFYLDKLCHDDPNESDKSYSVAKKSFKASDSTSFLDFVKTLWQEPELINTDIHVRRQVDFLIYNKYDDYFCLENYEQAIEKIFRTTGLKIVDTRGMGSGNTTHKHIENEDINYDTGASEIGKLMKIGKKPNIKNMYSDEIIRMVSVLFLPDILLYLDKINDSGEEMNYWITRIIQG